MTKKKNVDLLHDIIIYSTSMLHVQIQGHNIGQLKEENAYKTEVKWKAGIKINFKGTKSNNSQIYSPIKFKLFKFIFPPFLKL